MSDDIIIIFLCFFFFWSFATTNNVSGVQSKSVFRKIFFGFCCEKIHYEEKREREIR